MTSDIVVHIAHKLATVKNVSVNVSDTSPRTSSTMENEDANVAENRNATNAGTLSEASRQRTFRRNCFVFRLRRLRRRRRRKREREKEMASRACFTSTTFTHSTRREKKRRERGERIKRERRRKKKRPQKNRAPHPPRRRGRETCPSRRRFREARATFIRVCV